MSVRILIGDVRDRLRDLPDESVHCVVTSPPYWGLRDYGTAQWEGGDPECDHTDKSFGKGRGEGVWFDGEKPREVPQGRPCLGNVCPRCNARRIDRQLGMEPTLGEHIETMVSVFREVRRVLRKDGTVWLNYGDCYATAPNGRSAADTKATGNDDRTFRDKPFSTVGPILNPERANVRQTKHPNGTEPRARVEAGGVLKAKDLCMIPNRLAIALQDDGWWVRSEIIWFKPNPMPESVTDRPATAHEKIWLLTRSARYWYDAEAVKTPYSDVSIARLTQSTFEQQQGGPKDPKTGNRSHRKALNNQRERLIKHEKWKSRYEGWEEVKAQGLGANLRNVWTVPTKGFSEAHFATFPPDLIIPCIKAGCPEGGTVLDPFGGSGTTGMVADRLGRNAILIELNPEYAEMAQRRITDDAGMFHTVEIEQRAEAAE